MKTKLSFLCLLLSLSCGAIIEKDINGLIPYNVKGEAGFIILAQGSEGDTHLYFEKDSKVIWETVTKRPYEYSVSGKQFVLNNDILYFFTGFVGEGFTLNALSPTVGKILWQYDFEKKFKPCNTANFIVKDEQILVFLYDSSEMKIISFTDGRVNWENTCKPVFAQGQKSGFPLEFKEDLLWGFREFMLLSREYGSITELSSELNQIFSKSDLAGISGGQYLFYDYAEDYLFFFNSDTKAIKTIFSKLVPTEDGFIDTGFMMQIGDLLIYKVTSSDQKDSLAAFSLKTGEVIYHNQSIPDETKIVSITSGFYGASKKSFLNLSVSFIPLVLANKISETLTLTAIKPLPGEILSENIQLNNATILNTFFKNGYFILRLNEFGKIRSFIFNSATGQWKESAFSPGIFLEHHPWQLEGKSLYGFDNSREGEKKFYESLDF